MKDLIFSGHKFEPIRTSSFFERHVVFGRIHQTDAIQFRSVRDDERSNFTRIHSQKWEYVSMLQWAFASQPFLVKMSKTFACALRTLIWSLAYTVIHTIFTACAHNLTKVSLVKNKQIIKNNSGTFDVQSTNVNLDKFGTAKITKLQFVDEKGSVKYLTVPGCYNIRLDTTFTESINHPYIESFVKVENDEICKKTRPNPYCSQTTHLGVRLVANNQVTW